MTNYNTPPRPLVAIIDRTPYADMRMLASTLWVPYNKPLRRAKDLTANPSLNFGKIRVERDPIDYTYDYLTEWQTYRLLKEMGARCYLNMFFKAFNEARKELMRLARANVG